VQLSVCRRVVADVKQGERNGVGDQVDVVVPTGEFMLVDELAAIHRRCAYHLHPSAVYVAKLRAMSGPNAARGHVVRKSIPVSTARCLLATSSIKMKLSNISTHVGLSLVVPYLNDV
jgi:hypothetical protein